MNKGADYGLIKICFQVVPCTMLYFEMSGVVCL